MNDMDSLSPDEAELRALADAVATARADSRPDVPHETVREEMARDMDNLRRKLAALPDA